MITVSAPAKINLTLEVLGKRADGYHEVRSVIQTISLADTLSFEVSETLEYISESPEWNGGASLVSRAARLLRDTCGTKMGAAISVTKRIPLLSGLGGDSSDAAATLLGLNALWGVGMVREELEPLARQLGSDVAFFLYGGTALLSGRGEVVTPLPPMPHRWVVLARPPVAPPPEKTGQLYRSLKPSHYTDGRITRRLVEALSSGVGFDESHLFNTFENVASAVFPGLETARQHMAKMGAAGVHLAGSGPTLFTMMVGRTDAADLTARLQGQRLEPILAETVPSG